MKTNGRNNTTWTPAWNHGKTQVIRVPAALIPEILDYARWLDRNRSLIAKDKRGDFSCNVVLQAIN